MHVAMLKVATWNVNGIRARERELLAFLEQEQPDVLCLQEIKAAPDQVPETLGQLPGYHAYWHGHKGYSGVSLHLSRERFGERPQFAHPDFDHETRIVTARTPDLLLASIYVPNGGKDFEAKKRFLNGLDQFVLQLREQRLSFLLCGDLNVAREDRDVHATLRKPDQIGRTPEEQAQFARILNHGVIDLGRQFSPDDDQLFTWWAPWRNMRQKNIGWRIDYVLASPDLAERAQSCRVLRELGSSDHGPLVAHFDFTPRPTVAGNAEPMPVQSTGPRQGNLPF
jgi:exodeoxyribonuclease-3